MNVIEGNFGSKEKPASAEDLYAALAEGIVKLGINTEDLRTAVVLYVPGQMLDVLTPDGSPENAMLLLELGKAFILNEMIAPTEED